MHALVCLLFLIGTTIAQASTRIPSGMSRNDREETMRVLSLGASSKILSDPYPLGGYAGFEVGLSAETLPSDNLNRLGATVNNSSSSLAFQSLSIGKGIYNDIDLYFNFTPWSPSDGLSAYGGLLRWSFFQAKYLPMSYSLIVHSNALNVHSAMTSTTFGGEIVSSVNLRHIAVYFGLGQVHAWGYFEPQSTDSNHREFDEVSELHAIIGASARIDQAFVAVELDRYTVSIYSAKLGLRF